MNERERLALLARNRARLTTALTDPERRSRPATTGASARAQEVERWRDGTPKSAIVRLEEELDEERYRVDPEYQGRPDVHQKMALLIKLRHERDSKNPPSTPGPTQAEYERNREQILRDQRAGVIQSEIDRLETRKSALEVE